MKRSFFTPTLTIATLVLTTLLILAVLPLASTATAPRLEAQPPEPLTALNSTEATEHSAPLSASSAPSAASGVQSPDATTRVSSALRSAPVRFIENVGQFDNRARFQVRGGDRTIWLAEDAIWITAFEQRTEGAEELGRDSPPHLRTSAPPPGRGVNVKLTFPDANPHPRIEPFDRLDTVVSYFIGNDPNEWRPNVPVWGGVRYLDLYPGVDLEVTGESGNWTLRLVFRNPQSEIHIPEVRLRVEGADTLTLDSNLLHLTTAVGGFTLPLLQAVTAGGTPLDLTEGRPEVNDTEVTFPFSLSFFSPQFTTQDNLDELLYSTFLGGSSSEWGRAIAVDGVGNAYVTGETSSSDFPTTAGAFDTSINSYDTFVVKLNATGTGLAYATFLGGSDREWSRAIAVDGVGSACVTGNTWSSDFPTTEGAFDTSYNGGSEDAFVVKLNATGTGLAYATFLGGSSLDVGYAIAVDGAGSLYVTGSTGSSDFPTTAGALDTSIDSYDAFVVKLNAGGSELVYSTFLGGSSSEWSQAIAVDGVGNTYVTGETSSSDFPTTAGAFDTSRNGLHEAFVVKLNAGGWELVYGTFLGGSSYDGGKAIAVDGAGSAYVCGSTESSDFPTTEGAFDTSYNSLYGSARNDAFVVKLNAVGTELAYATFLGGAWDDYGFAIALDEVGNAYVCGSTESSDFPTTEGAFDTGHNGPAAYNDAFVVKLNAGGSELVYGTFLGGSSYDEGKAIAVDGVGNGYVSGYTWSSNFPTTPGAFDTSYNGGNNDAFVAKLAVGGRPPLPPDITGIWQTQAHVDSGPNAGETFAGTVTLEQSGTQLSGTFVSGPYSGEANGTYVDSIVNLTYWTTTGYTSDITATVSLDGNTLFGNWTDNFGRAGTYTATRSVTPPTPQDPLILSASSTYASTEHVIARTSVYNSSFASKTFSVTVSLLKDGTTVDSQTQTPTVAGYSTASLTFDFGTRAAGSYRIKAELFDGPTLLKMKERDIAVLASDDQARALRWADLLKRSAEREFQEGADLVADTDADAMTRMGSELLGKAFSLLIGWLGDLGRAAGLLSTDVDSAAATVSAKLTDLKRAWSMSVVKGLRVAVMEEINAYLAPQRQQVTAKHQEMSAFVEDHEFTWPDGLERTLIAYDDAIRSRVESEEISAVLQPPRFIGKSTLTGYRASYDFYALYGEIFNAIALTAAVGAILLLVLTGVGLVTLPTLISALLALRHNASLIALGVTGLLGLIAIGMDTSFEHTVAPAITAQHAQSQDGFRAALEYASGVAFSDFTTKVTSIEGRRASLATQLRNADGKEARPLVETYIYSPDGRVVEILSAQPGLSPGQQTTLQGDVTLPPGPYRAVSAVHTRERIGLDTRAVIFQVPGPQVQLALGLADSQLTLGEALNATVLITNADTISGTGDLAVIAVSSDEANFRTWTVNLNPGASERLNYSFVPQAEGTYRLDVSVSDGYELLARQSTAYVVGAGASLALNYSAQALYAPGFEVTLPVTVTNAGTVPTSTTFSLVTLDRLNDLAQVYTETTTLAVGAGADVSLNATALPSAQPGLYTTRLLLDGTLHASLDFAVAAQDTLFADIYPDAVFHNVGDSVTLTVGIMDSVYTYTDATTDVTVWRPDGVTETVAMRSITTGQYEGNVTAPITGTYLASVEISKPNYRAIGSSTYFVAGQRSSLWPTLVGGPILGQTAPLTVTVRNEAGLAIEDATLVLSGTAESLVGNTDTSGLAVLWPSATVTDSYQLTVDKTGFAQTVTEVAVQVVTDTVPPWLYLDAPAVTNRTPLTITGGAEARTAVTVNTQPVAVDAQGRFTTTVTLSEGDNLLTAIATDPASNSTTVTQTVTLDIVPPALTVTNPVDGLFSLHQVISVTGNTEVGAGLTVSSTPATIDPASGAFNAWVLLRPGVNTLPVVATDAAGNTTTVILGVAHSCVFGDFDGNRRVEAVDIMQVACRWNTRVGDEDYHRLYDIDGNDEIDVADIYLMVDRWRESCE